MTRGRGSGDRIRVAVRLMPAGVMALLPRSTVDQRIMVLPTSRPREVSLLVARRLEREIGPSFGNWAWRWRLIDQLPTGAYRVRVDSAHRPMLESRPESAGSSESATAHLLEDDLVLLLANAAGDPPTAAESVRIYLRPRDVFALRIVQGRCACSVRIELSEFEANGRGLEGIVDRLLLEVPLNPADSPPSGPTVRCTPELASAATGASPTMQFDLVPLLDPATHGWRAALDEAQRSRSRQLAADFRQLVSAWATDAFLPARLRNQVRGSLTLAALARWAGVSIVLLGAAGALLRGGAGLLRAERFPLERARGLLQDDVRELESIRQLVAELHEGRSRTLTYLTAWDAVSRFLEPGTSLSSLNLTSDGALTAVGTAAERSAVLNSVRSAQADTSGAVRAFRLEEWNQREESGWFRLSGHLPVGSEGAPR